MVPLQILLARSFPDFPKRAGPPPRPFQYGRHLLDKSIILPLAMELAVPCEEALPAAVVQAGLRALPVRSHQQRALLARPCCAAALPALGLSSHRHSHRQTHTEKKRGSRCLTYYLIAIWTDFKKSHYGTLLSSSYTCSTYTKVGGTYVTAWKC